MNKRPVSYLQTDPRWAKLKYAVQGENSTIGGSGCGPTAAAMLIETLTGKAFTPIQSSESGYILFILCSAVFLFWHPLLSAQFQQNLSPT